ncbi:hypothetical protein H0H92_015722 [Tricholoma furcatifolium]|nr:hypothetical protein H0H92_015722 [Tricholoma furcatifolium]
MLELGALYVALYARATPVDYHWALYHHWTSTSGGTKYHIRNVGTSGWFSEHEPKAGIMKDFLLVGMMKITYIPPESHDALDTVLTAVPFDYPTVNCRSWVHDAIKAAMSVGLIQQFSLDELDKEAHAFGSSQFDDTAQNVQPRPIVEADAADNSKIIRRFQTC